MDIRVIRCDAGSYNDSISLGVDRSRLDQSGFSPDQSE